MKFKPLNIIIMSAINRKQALNWYIQGYDLQTIADHYKISVNAVRKALNNVNK